MIRSIIELDDMDIEYNFTNKTLDVYESEHMDSYTSAKPITRSQLIDMRNALNEIIWHMEPQDDTAHDTIKHDNTPLNTTKRGDTTANGG